MKLEGIKVGDTVLLSNEQVTVTRRTPTRIYVGENIFHASTGAGYGHTYPLKIRLMTPENLLHAERQKEIAAAQPLIEWLVFTQPTPDGRYEQQVITPDGLDLLLRTVPIFVLRTIGSRMRYMTNNEQLTLADAIRAQRQPETDLDGQPLDHSDIPPCPLCGSPARYFGPLVSKEETQYDFEIQCRDCTCSVHGTGATSESAKSASLARWSRRPLRGAP